MILIATTVTLVFSIFLFIIYMVCKSTSVNIDEDIINYKDNCMYTFRIYGIYGDNISYEISSSVLKCFTVDYFLNFYKNIYESVHKESKVIKIELYVSEKYEELKLIKTFKYD